MSYDSIIILGATATGKTGLSIELAKRLNTEIINADSMYIYKELSIGTAKPTTEEMQGVCHHLINVANPDQDFNVVDYRTLAKDVIDKFKNNQLIPIIVGGTGFYIDSLIKNYSYANTSHSEEIRKQLSEDLEKFGNEYLHNKLKEINIEMANKIHQNDSVRIIRALEICYQNKDNNHYINNEESILKNPLIIGLTMDREALYNKINMRVDIMLNNGLLDEVTKLYNKGYRPETHQSMKGIGYKEIIDYLDNKITIDDAIEKIKQHTRNYAKRQITWFKRNTDINWFDIQKDKNIIEKILELYNKKNPQ